MKLNALNACSERNKVTADTILVGIRRQSASGADRCVGVFTGVNLYIKAERAAWSNIS